MTPAMIEARLLEIAKRAKDEEVAHIMERTLWSDVLLAIAEGRCEDPKACAALVLKSEEIPFNRWFS